MKICEYSQHFIFFVTHKYAQYCRAPDPTQPFQSRVMKQSSLLGPLLSYEENEVL
jgi:hypothetical protein